MRISDWNSDVCSSDLTFHPAFAVILTVAMPIVMSAYLGVAEAAAAIARERARQRPADPVAPLLIGELENLLATAEIAVDDMIRLANGFDFTPTTELASKVLVRKAIAAKAVIAAVEKALERSEEHTSELQSLMRLAYAVFRLKQK